VYRRGERALIYSRKKKKGGEILYLPSAREGTGGKKGGQEDLGGAERKDVEGKGEGQQ